MFNTCLAHSQQPTIPISSHLPSTSISRIPEAISLCQLFDHLTCIRFPNQNSLLPPQTLLSISFGSSCVRTIWATLANSNELHEIMAIESLSISISPDLDALLVTWARLYSQVYNLFSLSFTVIYFNSGSQHIG